MLYERISVTTEADESEDYEPIKPYLWLWSEVITQAIDEYRGSNDILKAQAKRWLFFSSESGPGSFEWACHAIGKDPNFIRNRINPDWRKEKTEKERVFKYHIPKLGEHV